MPTNGLVASESIPDMSNEPIEDAEMPVISETLTEPAIAEAPVKPLFLSAQDPSTWKKPEGVTWGDHFLEPGKPLRARHRLLAKMLAQGCTSNEIAVKLGYTPGRVSVLCGNTKILNEVERLQDYMFETDLDERMKQLAPEAANVIEEILSSTTLPPEKKENAARWLLEKVSGKPAQQIDLKGNISVGVFLDKLEQIKAGGQIINVNAAPANQSPEAGTPEAHDGEAHDVAEHDGEPADPLAAWIQDNLDK